MPLARPDAPGEGPLPPKPPKSVKPLGERPGEPQRERGELASPSEAAEAAKSSLGCSVDAEVLDVEMQVGTVQGSGTFTPPPSVEKERERAKKASRGAQPPPPPPQPPPHRRTAAAAEAAAAKAAAFRAPLAEAIARREPAVLRAAGVAAAQGECFGYFVEDCKAQYATDVTALQAATPLPRQQVFNSTQTQLNSTQLNLTQLTSIIFCDKAFFSLISPINILCISLSLGCFGLLM